MGLEKHKVGFLFVINVKTKVTNVKIEKTKVYFRVSYISKEYYSNSSM